MSPLRTYAPFWLLVAAQLLVVLVAPSMPASQPGALGAGPLGSQSQGAATVPGGGGTVGGPGGLGPGGPGSGTPGGATAGGQGGAFTASGGAGGGQSTGPGGSAKAGGKHCITGLLEHPPCVPGWSGGANGGATSQGVTAKTVRVVMYRNGENEAVNAILRSTGTYISPENEKRMVEVVENWVNDHYQLYGRKIDFIHVHGRCNPAPPDDSCFRSDADSIVAKYHPFAVFWDNDTNEAAFHDELARKGVISWGGWGFTDSFNNNLRPYHYELFMGGDTQAMITGEWWCRRMANRKARYAGDADLRMKTRKVAVIYPDTAVTTPSARRLESIINRCAPGSVFDSPYSSDTSTAASQSSTQTTKQKSAGVTSALWFSDPIAPAYGTKAQASQDYHPEQVLAGSGLLDYDALAQTYEESEWKHAFGPSDLAKNTSVNEQDAGRIWRAEHQSGSPDPNSNLLTSYALTVAGGIQAAGPKLTPLTYEYGMLTTPGYDQWSRWHDPRLIYIKFGRGDYTGVSDIREVFYDPNKVSQTNGRRGAYVALNGGRRYQPGQVPRSAFRK
jgi:hypothetical protein